MKYPLLHELFDNICEKYPSRIAIEDAQQRISYQELQQYSLQLAACLMGTGTERETVVATLLPAGRELAASALALFRTGRVYMPLDARIPVARLHKMLTSTGCEIIIADTSVLDAIQRMLKEAGTCLRYVMVLGQGEPQLFTVNAARELTAAVAITGHQEPSATEPSDSCYIFFTSGTTGEGKPILGSHRGLSQFIHWEIREFNLDETSRVSQLAQITFDASLRDMFVPLCTGGTLCIPGQDIKFQMPALIRWLKHNSISMVHCVPSLFRMLIKELEQQGAHAGNHFPDLKYILMAGEMLYAKDVMAWRSLCGSSTELVNMYGTSETTMAKTFHRIAAVPEDPGEALHVGQPIDQAFVAIMNGNRLCRIGEIGEIFILSHYISKGYYRQPDKTAACFVPNPLEGSTVKVAHRTGDLGRYRKDRSIEVLGRQDDQVKVNGIRVELQELENIILETEGITQVVLKAMENAEKAVELACYYTGTPQDPGKLRKRLEEKISGSVMPVCFMHLKEFQLSLNGKVDKAALPRPTHVKAAETKADDAKTPAESEMEEIWKEVFKIAQVGRNVSFFSIGGTSLKAIRIISQIYKRFEVLLTINDLFAHPTIAALTALTEKGRKKEYAAIQPLGKQDTYELSGVQKRIWAIDQFSDNGALYNVPEIYLFEGTLQRESFERAIHSLVERHEILRTTFELVNGEPRQRIHDADSWNFSLDFHDYSIYETPLENAIALSADASLKTFDLEKGPMIRAILVRLSERSHVFIFVTHHIISDAWSQEVIARDVLAFYDAYTTGRKPVLEPLKIQYKDFAAWQNKKLMQRLDHHRSFWIEQFVDGVTPMKLPLDYPRPQQQTFNAKETTFRLEESTSKSLRALAQRHTASGFNLVLSLVNLLLYKYTDQQDIVIGSPVADRGHADTDNQVGVYFNTLPLRTRFCGEDTFGQLLDNVKQLTLKAFEHIDYPFENILEDINLDIDKQRNPLFDVGLTYISFLNIGGEEEAGDQQEGDAAIRVKGIYPGFKFIKSDLWIKAVENGNEPFLFVFSYNTDLFRPAFATKLIDDFRNLAALVAERPDATLSSLVEKAREAEAAASVQKQQQVRDRNLEVLKNFRVGTR
ncbi:non-ribosomal peptide synthetase [Chitinophaga japonensis]|uniref:Amino acid adenylation domain-containing protein n=1 Tax=Chitinophaga japonensis TaxID=104662 RepID=A0A562SLR0_CHIJA|nr:non-ribosomal peptide synthetase [Chitinophaga japonensis]TWI82132.1 amino acid adenylation domain-containing protein [Chitinophaga japonensis]